MNKILLIICFIFFSFFSSAQIITTVDVIGSYDFENELAFTIDARGRGNITRQNFRFGANINFRTSDHGFVKTGIRFVSHVHKFFDGRLSDGSQYQQYLVEYFFEVPLIYRYEFSERKFSLYSEIGVSPHFYLKRELLPQDNSKIPIIEIQIPYLQERGVRLGLVMGFGFNYEFTKNMQLFFQPTYRFYPPLRNLTFPFTGTYNFGFEFGVRRALNHTKQKRF